MIIIMKMRTTMMMMLVMVMVMATKFKSVANVKLMMIMDCVDNQIQSVFF